MNRLHKHCLLASAGLHLLLVGVLLLGSAFFAPPVRPQKPDLAGQGTPSVIQVFQVPDDAAPAASTTPQSAAVPVARPAPVPRPVQEFNPPAAVTDSVTPEVIHRPHLPQISTTLVTVNTGHRSPTGQRSSRSQTTVDDRAGRFGDAVDHLFSHLSGGTAINTDFGPGRGNASFSYAQIVKEVYTRTWDPAGVTSDEATATVSVKIARNGKVLSAQVVRASGDAQLNQSVERALERVTFVEPFEACAKEEQRTFTMNFNLRAKLGY